MTRKSEQPDAERRSRRRRLKRQSVDAKSWEWTSIATPASRRIETRPRESDLPHAVGPPRDCHQHPPESDEAPSNWERDVRLSKPEEMALKELGMKPRDATIETYAPAHIQEGPSRLAPLKHTNVEVT
jgi:hypothetical protein